MYISMGLRDILPLLFVEAAPRTLSTMLVYDL